MLVRFLLAAGLSAGLCGLPPGRTGDAVAQTAAQASPSKAAIPQPGASPVTTAPPPKTGAGKAANPAPAQAPAPAGLPERPPPQKSAAEARYFAEIDKAIAPVRDVVPSPEDLKRLEAVNRSVGARDVATARTDAAAIADPVVRKSADWMRLRAGLGEIAEIRAFLDRNPGWPDADAMITRIEEKLLAAPPAAVEDIRRMVGGDPRSPAGHAASARVLLAAGDKSRAATFARRAWTDEALSDAAEALVLEHLGQLLTPADHRLRLDRLLIGDERWNKDRAARAADARRVVPLLTDPEKKKAEARIAGFLRAKTAKAQLDALPKEPQPDWGVVFARIQEARRAGRDEEAWKIMLDVPPEAERTTDPDGWWGERRALVYEALDAENYRVAYDLARLGRPAGVNGRKEQAFLAGWLAFRYLNDPQAAGSHFEAMRQAVDGPLSRAKAEYWSGRVAEALGDRAKARTHFEAASRHADTFHGQLSLAKIGADRKPFAFAPPVLPAAEDARAWNADERVRAAVVLHKAGLVGPARTFLFHLVRAEKTGEAQAGMLAHLAEALGDTQAAVRIGKAAIARGYSLAVYAYPTHPMPAYKPLRQPPEPAFLLAIARQESEFNRTIVSGAGARGLLQVMPITARHVCKDYKIKCEIPRLLTDTSYNARIASAYIADRMDEFAGSYVLTLAGYNAGPGRARQWIARFGDPRDPKVDPVDWIERIPFEETREYVAKVLSNIQVYRARLGDEVAGLRLMSDLARARGRTEPVKAAGGDAPVTR